MPRLWRPPPSLRALGWFWAVFLIVMVAGALTLQVLGPPPPGLSRPRAVEHPPAGTPATPQTAPEPRSASSGPQRPAVVAGRSTPGPIADPDPDLMEPGGPPDGLLPRIAPDGRASMQVYAHGFDGTTERPRIGLIVAGVGLNEADSEDAIQTLPAGITLAFSPYAPAPGKLLEQARAAGHELVISIPMEPQGYPINDAGTEALLTAAPVAQNRQRLDWTLSRIAGYVGATGALGTLRGERFGGSAEQMTPVLQTLTARGLLYVDPRPGSPPPPDVWGRGIDLVIDEPAVRPEIEAKLARLEQIAREKGSALGLVGAVRPVTVERLAAWTGGLAGRGIALAPVSALVLPPHPQGAAP